MHRNTYSNIDNLWMATVRDVLAFGSNLDSRVGGCREVVGYSATLTDPTQNVLRNPGRKLAPAYAAAELLWYLSGDREIDGIVAYAPRYASFANDGVAHGAYGWRWAHNPGFVFQSDNVYSNQMDALLTLLRKSPNTRQAVVTCWDSEDLVHSIAGVRKDTPCTVSLQFLVREGQVNMVVNMRSNDVWLGLPYDVFCFTTVQQLVATALGLKLGTYTHNVGSMHLYDRNFDRAVEATANPLGNPYGDFEDGAGHAAYATALTQEEAIEALTEGGGRWVRAERSLRTGSAFDEPRGPHSTSNYMDDLVYLCADKLACELYPGVMQKKIVRPEWHELLSRQ